MKIKNLGEYDNIVVWGIGASFLKNYQYQFRVDFLFDKSPSARENIVSKIPFISMERLSDICQGGGVHWLLLGLLSIMRILHERLRRINCVVILSE